MLQPLPLFIPFLNRTIPSQELKQALLLCLLVCLLLCLPLRTSLCMLSLFVCLLLIHCRQLADQRLNGANQTLHVRLRGIIPQLRHGRCGSQARG
jgi:hypothetical protein